MKRFIAVILAFVSFVSLGEFMPEALAKQLTITNTTNLNVDILNKEEDPNLYCLAQNIYHESRGESMWGQVAVGLVVMNRVESKRYPNNVCDVIHEGPLRESWKTRLTEDPDDAVFYPVKNKCQFSWYCDGKADTIYKDLAWRKAQEIAYRIAVLNQFEGLAEGATHYHATYVTPYWQSKLYLVGRVDTHLFYRTDK